MRLYKTADSTILSPDKISTSNSILRFDDRFIDTFIGYLMFDHQLYRDGIVERRDASRNETLLG